MSKGRSFAELSAIKHYSDRNGLSKAAEHYKISVDVIKNIRRRYAQSLEEFAASFKPEMIVRLRGAAIRHAAAHGYTEYAKDFASYCMIQRLTHRTIDLKLAWSDFKAETFGDSRSQVGFIQRTAPVMSIVEEEWEGREHVGVQVAAPIEKDSKAIDRIAREFKLEPQDRMILILYLHFDLNYREIGLVLNCPSHRIHAEMKRILRELKEKGIEDE